MTHAEAVDECCANEHLNGYVEIIGENAAEKAAAIGKKYGVAVYANLEDAPNTAVISCPERSRIANDLTISDETAARAIDEINIEYGVNIQDCDLCF